MFNSKTAQAQCWKEMKYQVLHTPLSPREVLLSLPLPIYPLSRSSGPPAHPKHLRTFKEPLQRGEVAAPLHRQGSKQHLVLLISPRSTWKAPEVSYKAFLNAYRPLHLLR